MLKTLVIKSNGENGLLPVMKSNQKKKKQEKPDTEQIV